VSGLRVLLVNHTARVSGGELSLLELAAGLDAQGIDVIVASPDGDLADRATRAGLRRVELHGTDGSLRLHPMHSARAVADLARAAAAIRRTSRHVGAAVVHANSVRAGIAAVLARRAGAPPVIVHVRDVLPPGRATAVIRRLIAAGADRVVANSRYTARAFAAPEPITRVVHSPVDTSRFAVAAGVSRDVARQRLGIAGDRPLLGVVAQLSPWKGQDDAIRALARVRTRPRPRLLVAGGVLFDAPGTRFDNRAYLDGLHALVRSERLEDDVDFLGERDDVPLLMRALDLLLVPSWEEPFGRSVVEAMAAGTPVVATAVGGPAEIITDGLDGTLVAPRRPEQWAEAIDSLLSDARLRERQVERAAATVEERFGLAAHVAAVAAIYRELS
jgi:glycosyltransferase involved in cell wall biosynthesis